MDLRARMGPAPQTGRGMVVPSKKKWSKPELQRFRSLDQAVAHYSEKATAEELEKLQALGNQARQDST